MDFNKVTAIEIPEGKVAKIEDKDGNILWRALPDPNKYAYGIRWDHTVPESQATTACERIGNLELHKTLPIQSKFACCVHQGTTIQYWCHPDDTRFRRLSRKVHQYYCNYDTYHIQISMPGDINIVPASTLASQFNTYNIGTIDDCRTPSGRIDTVISISDINLTQQQSEEVTLFNTTYKYLYMWIKIIYTDTEGVKQTNIARVEYVDTANKLAYLAFEDSTKVNATIQALQNEDTYTNGVFIELGSSLNGYDGEISVYTPKFYIWSIDKDGAGNEVWISEKKCVDYAREVKAHLIGISRCPLLRTAMNDDKWGWLNTLSDNTSVSVINYQPNLRGGTNDTNYDQYLGDNNFRTMLGKAASNMPLSTIRTYTQKIKGSQVLYYQIWNAIVWCYFIEYANFDVKNAFNSNLTSEGYHQGGLGEGLIDVNNWDKYNSYTSIVPIDYTLSAGNNTKLISKPSHSFDSFVQKQLNVPCYRGFNTFWYGDIWLNIENFISQYDSTSNKRKFYFTDNPNNFSNDINNKEHIIEINPKLTGWAKEIAIGNNANLITNKVSNTTNYTNCFRYDDNNAFVHTTVVGGSLSVGSHCGLACLACHYGVDRARSDVGFSKCYIIN